MFAALRAEASGFLLKDTPPGDLLAAVRVVALGDALLSPSVPRQLPNGSGWVFMWGPVVTGFLR